MAALFGGGVVMDAFSVAFRIPNLARRLFGEGALTAAFLPTFIREMEQLGYTDLSPNRLEQFRIHGVTPEFVEAMAEVGYDGIPAKTLVQMRIHGVDASFVRQLERRGIKDLSTKELIDMKIHGW